MKISKNIYKIILFFIFALLTAIVAVCRIYRSRYNYILLGYCIKNQTTAFGVSILSFLDISDLIGFPLVAFFTLSVCIFHIVINAKAIVKYIALGAEKRAAIRAERAEEKKQKKIERMQEKINRMKDD